MEFDKSRVYTALNAEEVKPGSTGYFADKIYELKQQVLRGDSADTLAAVQSDGSPFISQHSFAYEAFYLIDEPKEKKWRAYKDTDEMVADFMKRFNVNVPDYAMPLIWVTHKEVASYRGLMTDFDVKGVLINNEFISLESLFGGFTYLDGSPCGKGAEE